MSPGIKDAPWQCCCKPWLGPLCGECIEGALTAAVSLSDAWQLNIMMAQTSSFLSNNAASLFARSCLLSLIFFFFCSDSRAREYDAVQPQGLTSCFADLLTDRLTAFALPFTLFATLHHHRFLSGFCQKFPTKLSLMQIACTLSLSATCVCAHMFVSLESAGASPPPPWYSTNSFLLSVFSFLFHKLAVIQVRWSCEPLPGCALPPSLFHLQLNTELPKELLLILNCKTKDEDPSLVYLFLFNIFLCVCITIQNS